MKTVSIKLATLLAGIMICLWAGSGCKSAKAATRNLSGADQANKSDQEIKDKIKQINRTLEDLDFYKDRANHYPNEKAKIVLQSMLDDHFADGRRNKNAEALLRNLQIYLDDLSKEIELCRGVSDLDFFDQGTNK